MAKQGGTWVLGPESYASTPGIGLSLGAGRADTEHRGSAGTLGGYVELFNDAGQFQGVYSLTSWHVARGGLNSSTAACPQRQ
jgi:hypothetical protein